MWKKIKIFFVTWWILLGWIKDFYKEYRKQKKIYKHNPEQFFLDINADKGYNKEHERFYN
jgi:hypothetical protein